MIVRAISDVAHCLRYHEPPADFEIDGASRSRLAASVGASGVVVAEKSYAFETVTTAEDGEREPAPADDEEREFAALVRDLLRGRAITITESNAAFLSQLSSQYELPELRKATQRFLDAHDSFVLSLCLHARDALLTVLEGLGFWGRILYTFWDLFGCLAAIVCVMNLTLSLCTMGLYVVADHAALYIFLLLPFALFALTFASLFNIPALEFLAFRFLRHGYDSFFFTHQRLFLAFLRVLPCGFTRAHPFSFGVVYHLVFGVVFFALGISLIQGMGFTPSNSVEVLIVIFALGVPPVKYHSLYFFYALHSWASLVPACRAKFLSNGDFADPFLCAIYLGRTAWRDLWAHAHADHPDATWRTHALAIAKAVCSRTTVACYLVIASSAFLISQHALLSAKSAFMFILIVFVLALPLCATIAFPLFLLRNLRPQAPTNDQVTREFAHVADADCPRDVFFRYVAHADEHRPLRYLSIVVTAAAIALALIVFIVAVSRGKGEQPARARVLTDARHRVTHAICDATVKNLSMLQIGHLAQIPLQGDGDLSLLPIVFGSQNVSNFELRETGLGAISHVFIRDRRLHVFALRGTRTLADVLVDAELWGASVFLTLFRPFVPLLASFGHLGADYMNSMLSLPRVVFQPLSVTDLYIRQLTSYLGTVPIPEDEDALFTGHSLGGGLAKILAMITGFASVAWSGPGTSGTDVLYGGGRKGTVLNIVSVCPEQDWVAGIDPSEGTTFKIPCRAGAFACHDLPRDLCQIAAMCGTFEQTREWCEGWFDAEEIEDILTLAAPRYTTPG
jgi:hypothetical protein